MSEVDRLEAEISTRADEIREFTIKVNHLLNKPVAESVDAIDAEVKEVMETMADIENSISVLQNELNDLKGRREHFLSYAEYPDLERFGSPSNLFMNRMYEVRRMMLSALTERERLRNLLQQRADTLLERLEALREMAPPRPVHEGIGALPRAPFEAERMPLALMPLAGEQPGHHIVGLGRKPPPGGAGGFIGAPLTLRESVESELQKKGFAVKKAEIEESVPGIPGTGKYEDVAVVDAGAGEICPVCNSGTLSESGRMLKVVVRFGAEEKPELICSNPGCPSNAMGQEYEHKAAAEKEAGLV
jgi:hypothetical protein